MDGCNAEGAEGVPPLGGSADFRDFSSDIRGGGMGVFIGGECLGGGMAVTNEVVHLEASEYHCGIYF